MIIINLQREYMKTVISQGNLSGYYLTNKVDVVDIDKLNRKIKSIKTALKIAEKHNEDLHLKIKNQKENHQMEIIQLENQYKKYKELYEMLLEKYEVKSVELKEYKKKLKRMEVEQNRLVQIDSDDELYKEFKETIFKQEKELIRMKEENKLLYEQLFDKNNKLKEMETIISKNYTNHKVEIKDKSFLINLKSAIQSKNDQFQKINQEKSKLLTWKHQLEKQNSELTLKATKIHAQLQYQKKASKEYKEKIEKYQREISKLSQQNKGMMGKYQQLLNFSYDAQKDMERQLQNITKDIFRKDHK